MPRNRFKDTLDKLAAMQAAFSEVGKLGQTERLAFLFIARNEGASLIDVATALNIPQSTASRVIDNLCEQHGVGLIRRAQDPQERRKVTLDPTTKGWELVKKLANIIGVLALACLFLSFAFGPALHAADARPTVQLVETILQPFDCVIPNVLDNGDCNDHSIFEWGAGSAS